jgi:hypothetical protein
LLEAIRHLETWERDVLEAMRQIRRTAMSDILFAKSGLASLVYRRRLFAWEQEAYKIGLYELQKLSLAGSPGTASAPANIEQYLSIAGIAPGEAIETEVLVAASETIADYPAPISGIASSRSNR